MKQVHGIITCKKKYRQGCICNMIPFCKCTYVWSVILNWGWFCPSGYIWQCQQIYLVITNVEARDTAEHHNKELSYSNCWLFNRWSWPLNNTGLNFEIPRTQEFIHTWIFFNKYSIYIFILEILKLNVGKSLYSVRDHNMWSQKN